MKIICDCGAELLLTETGDKDQYGESDIVTQSNYAWSIAAEHNELWITCDKCTKSVYLMC